MNTRLARRFFAPKHLAKVLLYYPDILFSLILKPMGPAEVTIKLDGKEFAKGTVARTVPVAFSASESFEVGIDMGSPVSMRYHYKHPSNSTVEFIP